MSFQINDLTLVPGSKVYFGKYILPDGQIAFACDTGTHSETDVDYMAFLLNGQLYIHPTKDFQDQHDIQRIETGPMQNLKDLANQDNLAPGKYMHYKNKVYEVYGTDI